MHQNPWWLTPEGPTLDAGAFVAGLEFATGPAPGSSASPIPEFFSVGRRRTFADEVGRGLARADIAMVGDDLRADVRPRSASACAGSSCCPASTALADVDRRERSVAGAGRRGRRTAWPRRGRRRRRARLTATFRAPPALPPADTRAHRP